MNISLVIPLKNEEKTVLRLLNSISRQERLPDEVIFVNAGSTDRTREIIEAYDDGRLARKIISTADAFPGTARNEGVRHAQHDIIAFTDGGIELEKGWLEGMSALLEKDPGIDVVYGGYTPRTDSFFTKCYSLAFVAPLREGKIRTPFIASSLVKKNVWNAIGGFPDLRAAEDRIFMEKIEERKYRIGFAPQAGVVWDIPGDMISAFKRFRAYSYHDLIAGRNRDWHLPVAKMYAAGLLCVSLGILISPLFYALPLIGLSARTIKKIAEKANEPFFKRREIISYFFSCIFLIVFIDCAMFTGLLQYVCAGRRRRAV